MNEEFYIGQKFYTPYPVEAAVWCNRNNAEIIEDYDEIDGRYYKIIAVPEPPVPTHDDISNMRKWAYTDEVDGLHAQKIRHQILGDWTEEDEIKYRQKVIQLSKKIEEEFPYYD